MNDITTKTASQSLDGFTFDLQRFDSAFSGGSGTESDPYKISNANDLKQLATDVNGGTDYSGKYFKLTGDIDLSSVDNWATLIGTDDDHQFNGTFNGTFNGNGHTIKNLTINLTDNNYIGLFGYIGGDATIQNLRLADFNVTGKNYIGGLVGYSEGGTFKNITLNNVFVYGKTWSGGIVGENEGGTISDCTVTDGQIVGTNSYVGGIVSYNGSSCTVSNCTFNGTVTGDGHYVGGIVGYNKSEVTNCSASGTISGTYETSSGVGGLVGYNQGGTVKDGPFSNVEVSGQNEVGGLVGYNSGSGTVSGNKFSSNADAVGENYGTVENNTRYHLLTLPEGVNVSGDIITIGDKIYASGTVTFKVTDIMSSFDDTNPEIWQPQIESFGEVIGDLEEDTSTIVKGSSEVLHLGDYTLTITAVDDVALKIEFTDNGLSIVPNQGGGAFSVTLSRGDTEIISGELECTSGKITFGYDKSITLAKDTTVNFKQGDYNLTITTTDEATINVDFTEEEILITPNTDDGTLNLTLSSADGSFNANVEVVSGSFTFGNDGALTVAKNTELQINFGDGYIVNFKATDTAGGKISIGADGITFAPNSSDGGLKISVTRDDETRSASLDVTGSVTYNLDGSISLAKGTVVRNVFEDGEILTITANTDASGTMRFSTEGGLSVTPATPDAFSLSLASVAKARTLYLTEITGTVTYKSGDVILSDGTSIIGSYDAQASTGGTTFKSEGGEGIIRITSDGLALISEDGARVSVVNERNHGCYVNDGKATLKASTSQFSVSEGSNVEISNPRFPVVLETAGNYTLNGMSVTTSADNVEVQLTNYNTVAFSQNTEINLATTLSGSPLDVTATALEGQASVTVDDDGNITYDATDATLQVTIGLNEIIGESILPNVFTISGGSITMGATDANGLKSISITAGTELSFTQNGMTFTGVVQNDINGRLWMRDNSVLYLHSYDKADFDTTILSNGQTIFNGMMTIDGAFSYSAERGTVGAVDSNTYNVHDSSIQFAVGNQKLKLTTNGDTFFAVLSTDDSGKITFTFSNEKYSSFLLTANTGGKDVFEAVLTVNGSFVVDPAAQEITLTEGSTINIDSNLGDFSITALNDAGGQLTFTDAGIRFAPNAGDGALEIKFADTGRKVNLDISGAVIFNNDGKISFEDGTEVNLAWEDGVNLKLISHGSTGSIVLGENGIQITSDDENLDLELSTPYGYSTKVSGLKGSLWYNAGKVILDEGTKLTGTGTLGEQVVNVTVETQGGDAYLDFSASDGFVYGAGTGALKVTYALGDLESTFIVNSGSVLIGQNILAIAEGTDLSTDLKDFIPALHFTTTDAGEYTINGQTITTSTENISMTATDDRITFNPGDAIIEYDGMYFTGDGNVSLTQDGVILGAGIEATGFGETNTFILTEKGTVTADGKIFELVEDIPDGISVKGAQDGFSFSSTITEEGEERNGIKNSTDIGKTFTEKFSSTDGTYRVQAEIRGLQKVIGISDGATINGGMEFDGENMAQFLYIVTESEGTFTVGDKAYTIGGDSEVTIGTYFDETDSGTAIGFDGLNGTVTGDFTEYAVTINGGDSIIIKGDDDIAISANDNDLEIFGVSDGATLETFGGVSKAHTDGGGEFILGTTADESIKIATYTDATFDFDDEGYLTAINGTGLEIEGELSYVDVLGNVLFVYDMQNGWIETDAPKKVWVQMTGASLTLNGNELTLAEDADGIWIRDKEIVGLDEDASLTVGEAGIYTTSVTTLDAKAGDVIVGLGNDDAYIYDENNPLVTKKSTTEEIIEHFNPNDVTVIGSESRGKFDVTLNGGDLAVVEDTAAFVNITAGDDTVVSKGNHVNVNLTDGNTYLFPLAGKMTLENYDHSTSSGFGTNYSDIENAIYSGAIDFSKGILTLGSAQIDMSEDNLLMNFFDRDGNLQKFGYASAGGELDASDEKSDLLLFAENYSTIRGGSGDDTVFGNAGDFIDAGAGENHIELKRAEERYEHDQGATINIVNGNNTITNFQRGFDFESDLIKNNSKYWNQTFDGKNVTIKTDGGTTILEAVGKGGAAVSFKKATNDSAYNVTLIQEDSIAAVDEIADAYYGENSGVDFTGYSGQVLIDLDDKRGTAENSDVYFYGINKLTAGGGVTSLIGSSGNETLTAGTGRASIWGNWGNDLMVGNTSDDKKAGTEFFMFADDGHDTIDNFEFLTAQNSLTADRIYVGTSDINSATLRGDDVVINFDGSSDLTLTDAAGKNIQISDMIAKVDTDVEFDGIANTYIATDSNAELTVNDSLDSAEIWLDNSRDTKFFGDIRTLDASAVDGNTNLAGNALDNTIIGGAGFNTFNYMLGGGNDLIRGTNDGDVINLGVTLDEISSTDISASSVLLRFNDGGSLTVDGSSDVTYRLTDGSNFSADHANREWVAK